MKKALIVEGKVVGFDPGVAAGACALVVDVEDGVEIGWAWTPAGCAPPAGPHPDEALLAEIAELEAMQTPRLLREAMMNKNCTVTKPGCCIDGMTPAQALEAIEDRVAELRGQLSAVQYYQK